MSKYINLFFGASLMAFAVWDAAQGKYGSCAVDVFISLLNWGIYFDKK